MTKKGHTICGSGVCTSNLKIPRTIDSIFESCYGHCVYPEGPCPVLEDNFGRRTRRIQMAMLSSARHQFN
jgi:hypothetical protein